MKKMFSLVTLTLAALLVGILSPAWAGSLTWSGRVDDSVNIIVRGKSVKYRQVVGRDVRNDSYRFNGSLPPYFRNARLENAFGRGQMNIINRRDGQVVIHIDDPQSGGGDYRFILRWDDNNGGGGTANPGIVIGDGNGNGNGGNGNGGDWNGGNALRWHGTVDGVEGIRINGSNVTWNWVAGRGAWGVRFNVSGRLPSRNVRVRVNKNRGRGAVYVYQQPNYDNNFTCTIRVEDNQQGSDIYDFTASW